MNRPILHLIAPACWLALAAGAGPAGAQESAWNVLAEGLELARFAADAPEDQTVEITVLRIDPGRWQTVALAVSQVGGAPRSARRWAREFDLTAVINAGMYGTDHRTHTGYFRTGEHVDNAVWNQRDYRQAACWGPREPDLPPFALMDLDAAPESTFAHRWDIVIQNLRLIRKPGENRWPRTDRRWPEACLGEDVQGRMLWISCPTPLAMHDLNEILLALPLELVAAQHLEGGPEAQLWVDGHDVESAGGGWPVPNVLGIRPR